MDEEQLRAAYERIDGALVPPGDTTALVARRVRARRCRRRARFAVAGAAAAVVVASGVTWSLADSTGAPTSRRHASDTTSPSWSPSVAPISDLTCPTSKRAIGIYDSWSDTGGRPQEEIADGYRNAGVEAVIQDDRIFLLRPDGTAFAHLKLARISDGWRVQSSESCGGDPMPTPVELSAPTAQLDPDCTGATWRVGTVGNPEIHEAQSPDIDQVIQPWLILGKAYDLHAVGANNLIANLVAPNDRFYASLGLVRVDGRWRVESLSACTTEYPGLAAAKVFGSGLPRVGLLAVGEGHCWIETLEYVDESWDLRDEDQFGWGGLGPSRFLGVGSGTVSKDGERLTFVDLLGAKLDFVPADSPGTEMNEGGCK